MRLDGWEARLFALIDEARSNPYELGVHDCARLAGQVETALTGVDRWPRFAGYKTKREALAILAKWGSSFEAAFDAIFETIGVDVKFARRGDIVCIQTEDQEKHLGVCLGNQAAFLAPHGLVFVPTLTCLRCWRIG